MDGQVILDWCRGRPGVTEELPFGPDVLVFKAWGRMFAACPDAPEPDHVALKCDPHFAEHLRAEHPEITPAYHMSKRHWNDVRLGAGLPRDMLEELLGHSYTLVVDALPKRYRALVEGLAKLDEGLVRTGDFDPAESLLTEARRRAEADRDERCLAGALDGLGTALHFRNLEVRGEDGFPVAPPERVAEQKELLERALAIRRTLGVGAEIGESVFHVGLVHQLFTREWEQAAGCFAEARALAEAAGHVWLLSEARRHQGAVAWHARDFDQALDHLVASLELRRRIRFHEPSGLFALGQCELAAGRREEGIAHLREGLEQAEREGLREWYVAGPRRALAAATNA